MRIVRCLPLVLVPLLAACGPPPAPAQPTVETAPQATNDAANDTPPEANAEPDAKPEDRPKPEKLTIAPSGKGPQIQGIPGTSITFGGGDGSSADNAIVIQGAKGEMDGVASEYQFLSAVHGRKGRDWQLDQQSLIQHNGHQMDQMDIELSNGDKLTYFFDINAFFGKF